MCEKRYKKNFKLVAFMNHHYRGLEIGPTVAVSRTTTISGHLGQPTVALQDWQ